MIAEVSVYFYNAAQENVHRCMGDFATKIGLAVLQDNVEDMRRQCYKLMAIQQTA
jgi:hypothetical protein